LDYNIRNAGCSFLKHLDSSDVVINGDWNTLPELGGKGRKEEVITIRIDFNREQISMKREGSNPIVIAEGYDIRTSSFSLHAILSLKG